MINIHINILGEKKKIASQLTNLTILHEQCKNNYLTNWKYPARAHQYIQIKICLYEKKKKIKGNFFVMDRIVRAHNKYFPYIYMYFFFLCLCSFMNALCIFLTGQG